MESNNLFISIQLHYFKIKRLFRFKSGKIRKVARIDVSMLVAIDEFKRRAIFDRLASQPLYYLGHNAE